MPSVQYDVVVEVLKWVAPAHRTLHKVVGVYVTVVGGIRGKGGNLKVIKRLWAPP